VASSADLTRQLVKHLDPTRPEGRPDPWTLLDFWVMRGHCYGMHRNYSSMLQLWWKSRNSTRALTLMSVWFSSPSQKRELCVRRDSLNYLFRPHQFTCCTRYVPARLISKNYVSIALNYRDCSDAALLSAMEEVNQSWD